MIKQVPWSNMNYHSVQNVEITHTYGIRAAMIQRKASSIFYIKAFYMNMSIYTHSTIVLYLQASVTSAKYWLLSPGLHAFHYSDVIMGAMASQITNVSIVHSIVCSGANQRKHQSSASLASVRGIHRGPVNSPYKGPVTRKMFPFGDVISCIFLSNEGVVR